MQYRHRYAAHVATFADTKYHTLFLELFFGNLTSENISIVFPDPKKETDQVLNLLYAYGGMLHYYFTQKCFKVDVFNELYSLFVEKYLNSGLMSKTTEEKIISNFFNSGIFSKILNNYVTRILTQPFSKDHIHRMIDILNFAYRFEDLLAFKISDFDIEFKESQIFPKNWLFILCSDNVNIYKNNKDLFNKHLDQCLKVSQDTTFLGQHLMFYQLINFFTTENQPLNEVQISVIKKIISNFSSKDKDDKEFEKLVVCSILNQWTSEHTCDFSTINLKHQNITTESKDKDICSKILQKYIQNTVLPIHQQEFINYVNKQFENFTPPVKIDFLKLEYLKFLSRLFNKFLIEKELTKYDITVHINSFSESKTIEGILVTISQCNLMVLITDRFACKVVENFINTQYLPKKTQISKEKLLSIIEYFKSTLFSDKDIQELEKLISEKTSKQIPTEPKLSVTRVAATIINSPDEQTTNKQTNNKRTNNKQQQTKKNNFKVSKSKI